VTDGAATLGLTLLAVLVVTDLVLSPPYVRRVRAAVERGDPRARLRCYRLAVALDWAAAAVALVVLLAGGLTLAEIGFRLPTELGARGAALLAGAVGGLAVGAVLVVAQARRGEAPATAGDIDVLVPRTPSERRWYAALSVTAGVTEEIVYRAFALTVLTSVLPGGQWVAILVAAAAFGAAHAYQGRGGVLATTVLAIVFGFAYLETGSLLPSIVLHVLIDLRVLLLRPSGT
jgi:membrane protease YdiL (CAAX protease family)